MLSRNVYYISDSSGVTVELLAHSVLAQFPGVEFVDNPEVFIDTHEKAEAVARKIESHAAKGEERPIVFYTFADESIAGIIAKTDALTMNCLDIFIDPVAKELGRAPSHDVRRRVSSSQSNGYDRRIDALNFTITHDDGMTMQQYAQSDIILIGVSRSGKTPTSLYMALQYGIFAANYPLVDEDLTTTMLPPKLAEHADKLYGLSIAPQRLAQIRAVRRPESRYADLDNCRQQVQAAKRIFEENGIRYLDVTMRSVEELASKILQDANLKRYLS